MLDTLNLLKITTLINISMLIVVLFTYLVLGRIVIHKLYKNEFKIIYNKIFNEGNIAVAIYSGLVIGLLGLGLIIVIGLILV